VVSKSDFNDRLLLMGRCIGGKQQREEAMRPGLVFLIAWIAWAVSWTIAAVWSGKTVRKPATPATWLYRLLLLVGGVLLYYRTARWLGAGRLFHVGFDGGYALAGLAILGFVFAWWARIHLGRLWSGSVTLKEGHHVVESGPYAIVRHPIYTGLLLAVIATAVALATIPSLLSIAFIAAGIWLKARIEEDWLRAELGEGEYDSYRRRVPMLVPFAKP
jgi:protein-S-isoprenylcysteine O-methyltransferase Ste14